MYLSPYLLCCVVLCCVVLCCVVLCCVVLCCVVLCCVVLCCVVLCVECEVAAVCGHLEWTQGIGGLQSETAQKYDRSDVCAVETVETIDGSHAHHHVSLPLCLVFQQVA